MEEHLVRILNIEPVTRDVRRYTIERPSGYNFKPGQATDVAINKPPFREELRPFTFTGLNAWPNLEFTIKSYPHPGVTQQLGTIVPGEELLIHEVWGAIEYKGEGVFIAGGAGVTPFIAILRDLNDKNQVGNNKLFFSNKTAADIILKEEFTNILGKNFYNTLTRENNPDYDNRKINELFLKENIADFSVNFYVCGPEGFVKDINQLLSKLGASTDSIIFEK